MNPHCQRLCFEIRSGRFKHKTQQFIDWALSNNAVFVRDCIGFINSRMMNYYELYKLQADPFTMQNEEEMGKALYELVISKRAKE